jgi:hypothetical protein
MTQLRLLMINRCRVSGVGLCRLNSRDGLDLYMRQTNVADSALEQMASIRGSINRLDISDTQITDIGMRYVSAFEKLNDLRINNTAVTDEGVLQLASLKYLQHVEISGTRVTDRCVALMRRANRHLRFSR